MVLRCNVEKTTVELSASPSSISSPLRLTGGPAEADPGYRRSRSEETVKLQKLYGGGDLSSFPQFTFTGEYSVVPVSKYHLNYIWNILQNPFLCQRRFSFVQLKLSGS